MSRIAIVTDSSAYLPADLVERYGIHVMPLKVAFGQTVYRDCVDITEEEFYHKLAQAKELPVTSQPSAGEFLVFYQEVARQAQGIVSIHISGALSGTYNSAMTARDMLPDVPIEVVDSRSASMGQGFLALAAARAAEEGQGLSEIATLTRDLVPRLNVIFVLDTLKYLHKGGRIGGAQALMGSMLAIKPLLHLHEGRVEPLEKVRSRGKAVQRLVEIMAERLQGQPARVAILHSASRQEAEALRAEIAARFPCRELLLSGVSPVIGTHTGPGCLGLAFYAD
ncbi:MAG: DegV family protein [Chloroflexi bacterium]|nr:DegV family protein [Chloroflexota bacterium]